MKSCPLEHDMRTNVLCGKSKYCLYISITKEVYGIYISALQAQGQCVREVVPLHNTSPSVPPAPP